ncbi:hypothetical protein AAFC00_005530 [Neodothiora populina]|uniref:Phytanoyl-CoA dioxygenase n=1 Tax=Neodothiora populina TaxID=2781224 RepID=A0ABR3PL64_9PEZI
MPHAVQDSARLDDTVVYGDWRDELFRDGVVVVKGAIAKERAQDYVDEMFKWAEKFPYGFDKNDKSTWTPEHLPAHIKGGMYGGYGCQHEKFMWEARQEPGVLEAFAKVWGTDELLVSFDGFNFTLPTGTALPQTQPWPHVDQSPKRKGMQCVQGIINLAPNGPDDGGLLCMKGSQKINEEFFKTHPEVVERATWGSADWFGFDENEVKWFTDRGSKLVKICADPGDLILWDSRTMHHNCVPTTQNVRSVIYACYTPATFAHPDDLKMKAELFDQRTGTTHWPHANLFPHVAKPLRLGKPDPVERSAPFEEPVVTEQVLKLAGRVPY